ncbi:MAG: type I-B CRISPR-associated protein Cas7/Cst2/DevR [Anaerolineales bacterium]|nr:type I-B CRISPR-associated protein Cas7/Cst2/DevR [Anaerolineales bacterium]MCS7249055.1 type I-B CRISPR-associated protein Cas7/Cst2/DevR [Anaerolineales bacterium]MDW8162868.1 type I-B CRISPR-associated protein Cas7/Cst2/DevR [Anaerolineales bacterium]MDW8446845.1 type I-B CRISPR-associated protein Cas7/Cst2/DevR [Anaerolineales bacterium]
MAFVTGLFLIDAPASALNNLGSIPGERTDNTTGVKVIRAKDGYYPYVSAQAFRYWLRTTLEKAGIGWKAAPVYREEKVAYTDSNPIKYWDDDLFGYMRAQSTRASARAAREADTSRMAETPTTDTVTRVSPFRVSTLVSLAPVSLTQDFGVMARQEGDPVPFEHQFYRTTLKGLFSLNLAACGTFTYVQKTGYRNLDEERKKQAAEAGLEHLEDQKCYRLSKEERIQRISALFEGLTLLEGGAKLALHYTDVSPVIVFMAVTKGGNHIFNHIVSADAKGQPRVNHEAFEQVMDVFKDEILSPVYVGWTKGYLDEERARFEEFSRAYSGRVTIHHPRLAFREFIQDLQQQGSWLD